MPSPPALTVNSTYQSMSHLCVIRKSPKGGGTSFKAPTGAAASVVTCDYFLTSVMGNRSISRDVKIAALNLYEKGHLPLKSILACVGFSRSTFFRVLKLWKTTGDVERPQNCPGRPRFLVEEDVDYLITLVQNRPDWFLDEILKLLKKNRFISVHYTTIHRELVRAGMSLQVLQDIAEERNEPARLDFIREISDYPADYLGFMDETSKKRQNTRSSSRPRQERSSH
ncbi:hypothetical protein R3P38DRAFT_3234170 [Favolaschia claudopus]|uniref:Transposase n=1 Tax=Favolaschia claudopus TaxID=2862362 RepID=A0AAV9ZGI4_9AGAR